MEDKPATRRKAYTTAEAAELGGLAYPTLGYLSAKNILKPSVKLSGHQGAANAYSFADLLALRSISEIRKVPASLGTLNAVAVFWQSEEGLALADTRALGKVLVVTPDGRAKLENDSSVLELTAKYETNVLHVINAGGLVSDVHVEATSQHIIEPSPKRRGRPPGPRHRKPGSIEGEDRPQRTRKGEGRADRDVVRAETKKKKGRRSR
jgi:DNA-binding transcriptional MerR regulator